MEDTSTATQTEVEVPTPAEVAQAPTTEPVESEAAAPAPEAEAEQEATPVAEEKKYAVIDGKEYDDAYGVLDSPEFKDHLERRDGRVEARLTESLQRQFQEATGQWSAHETHKQIAGIYGNIAQKLEELSAAGVEGADRLLTRVEQIREKYGPANEARLASDGMEKAGSQFWGWMREGLDRKASDELEDFSRRRGVGWPEIIKKRDDLVGKATRDEGFRAGKKADTEAASTVSRTETRGGEGPNLATAQAKGGQSDDEFLERWGMRLETDDARAHKLLKERGVDVPTPRKR